MSGSNPLGVPGRRVGRAFLGQLVPGPFPFEALGSGRLARGVGPGPKVPIGVNVNKCEMQGVGFSIVKNRGSM